MKYNCSVCTKDLYRERYVYSWTPFVLPSIDEEKEVITVMYYACGNCYDFIAKARGQ